MQFQSYYYALLFLPTIFFTYNLLKKNNLKNILLIIASYYFYSWGNPLLAILLFSSSIVDFFIGKKLRELNNLELNDSNLKKENIKNNKKKYLILSIFFNIGLLFFFKYWDWSLGQIAGIILKINGPLNLRMAIDNYRHYIDVPPGISFYTF